MGKCWVGNDVRVSSRTKREGGKERSAREKTNEDEKQPV